MPYSGSVRIGQMPGHGQEGIFIMLNNEKAVRHPAAGCLTASYGLCLRPGCLCFLRKISDGAVYRAGFRMTLIPIPMASTPTWQAMLQDNLL